MFRILLVGVLLLAAAGAAQGVEQTEQHGSERNELMSFTMQ